VEGAHAWLARREPVPPPALGAALHAATMDRPVPHSLVAAALARLQRVLASSGDRTAAADLLAADALLTYACEAAAEQGGEVLAATTAEIAPTRLARLLPPETNEEPARG
jgi:hypothetical protein